MKYSEPNLFFIRYTPKNFSTEENYLDSVYDRVNQSYLIKNKEMLHQMSGVFEYSKKRVPHFHFCVVIPLSINSIRDKLKTRLDAKGNKEISVKQYEYNQESWDKSQVYMIKGDPLLEDPQFKLYEKDSKYFNFLGVPEYAKMWKDYTKKDNQKTQKSKINEKFEFFKAMALENIKKEHILHFSGTSVLKDVLYTHSHKTLYTIIFKTIVKWYLSQNSWSNFGHISEISHWLSLSIRGENNFDINEDILDIAMTKYEKYIKDNNDKLNF